MSELESLDLKNLHVIVLQEFQTEEIQELNTDFFRNLSSFIGNLKNEEYDGIENKTKSNMITIATSLTELLINKRLEKMSSESSSKFLEITSTKHKTKPVTVRFVKEFDEIVGVDLEKYGPFKPEDIATIPNENAQALISNGVALKVRIEE